MPHLLASPTDTTPSASRVPTWFRHALQRWVMPQLDPDDRMEPDLDNIMAHRPASARMRCVLSPLSGEAPLPRGVPTHR